MDLAKFLEARIGEDEHWAHMAEAGWPPENALAASEDPEHYPFMATDITPSKATFIRRHDPGRVLREVDAKRKILAEHHDEESWPGHCAVCLSDRAGFAETWNPDESPCQTLRLLAAVYRDHEDYDPAFKPSNAK